MNVAIRVDASGQIGFGHFMRCVSLADALRSRGAAVCFVTRQLPPHLQNLLDERTYEVVKVGARSVEADAGDTADVLAPRACDWLVVDHYALDARWEAALRPHAKRILVIDDVADRSHDCDVLLDQNLHAGMDRRYAGKVPATCRMLLGPAYALLRDQFRQARQHASPRTGVVRRVLVSFGGADPENRTGEAIEALAAAGSSATADVVIGAAHPHRGDIESACRRHGFTCHVQTARMAELMAAADAAIGAGGVTTWERCCMGLPALALSIAANQRAVVEAAARHGLLYTPAGATATGSALAVHVQALFDNPCLLQMMSRRGMRAVDGLGAERVAGVLDDASIHLREATFDDARALFEWRNDELVRRMSLRTNPIAWPEHEAWLQGVLSDADRVLLIGERNGRPVGVVRFDVTRAEAKVSIYRVPRSPERGLGSSLLAAAEAWLGARRPDVSCLTADVRADNERSHHLFRSTGYQLHFSQYTKPLHAS